MNNKNFCMSSYLAFRYIEREGMDFYEGLHHENIPLPNGHTLFSQAESSNKVETPSESRTLNDTAVSMAVPFTSSRTVQKIVIFYSDGTFEER